MLISSTANERVKLAASLHLKKYRDETGLFLVEGREMIEMARKQGWELEHLFTRDETATAEVLAKISKKDNPQDHIAAFKKKAPRQFPFAFEHVLPALEEIRDPGNLGTIMRTCHALGLKHILLIGNCCDPYAPETIRASMGSFAHVEMVTVTSAEMLAWKKNNPSANWIGTDVVHAADYREADYNGAVLMLGNEQKGLSESLKNACTSNVNIPMPGGTESLNVAMAATLLLYEALKGSI